MSDSSGIDSVIGDRAGFELSPRRADYLRENVRPVVNRLTRGVSSSRCFTRGDSGPVVGSWATMSDASSSRACRSTPTDEVDAAVVQRRQHVKRSVNSGELVDRAGG